MRAWNTAKIAKILDVRDAWITHCNELKQRLGHNILELKFALSTNDDVFDGHLFQTGSWWDTLSQSSIQKQFFLASKQMVASSEFQNVNFLAQPEIKIWRFCAKIASNEYLKKLKILVKAHKKAVFVLACDYTT